MAVHGVSEGRPTKATPERIEAILMALRGGATRKAAAGAAGIHYGTLHGWITANPDFLDEVEKAEDEAEARYTAIVFHAAAENWQAAAWWLERRRFRDYAKRERVEITHDVRTEIERMVSDPAEREAALAEAESIIARKG